MELSQGQMGVVAKMAWKVEEVMWKMAGEYDWWMQVVVWTMVSVELEVYLDTLLCALCMFLYIKARSGSRRRSRRRRRSKRRRHSRSSCVGVEWKGV